MRMARWSSTSTSVTPLPGTLLARAGEPGSPSRRGPLPRVYPRASGGTRKSRFWWSPNWGLSPRERGNRVDRDRRGRCGRSIPARAGEPARCPALVSATGVYPRASGGTFWVIALAATYAGLSPRERGNLGGGRRGRELERSIPARAGEPHVDLIMAVPPKVYPRASGGTFAGLAAAAFAKGLSPRERGNLINHPRHELREGSIPARAGEPRSPTPRPPTSWVYPRASGGTRPLPGARLGDGGLSPRERGNLLGDRVGRHVRRSIPARAGEPGWWATWARA